MVGILDQRKARALDYFAPDPISVQFHVYGRDRVMKELEREHSLAREVGLVIELTAATQELAHAACHQISGAMLHHHLYEGIINPSGNLAFPYSPSDLDIGPVYEFSAYHLMKVASSTELFPATLEEL